VILSHSSQDRGSGVLRRLEWSEGGHRYRAELRDVNERRVWFVAIDDELPREVFDSREAEVDEQQLRARIVLTIRIKA
jgi:hypothetical protein